ncbi:hypothetical protein LOAG_02436 [Loa loa]|uniref:Uncharacterized protein n=1 Tax=Loa loa TaxID=7209 RepID=A0A1S0U6P8_LOALO|nr:hypothetical protein LOAG_02436 [Loa loa]EFO26045.2 hypothetical protein LOAG_02436 [Loa loa]
MLNHQDKQCDNGDSVTSKHLEDYCNPVSSAEGNPKNNVTMAAILSQPVYDVFVQHDKGFRRTDRKQYEKMLEARTDDLVSIIPSESIQAALTVQTAFRSISLIIQGFLSGFGTSHAIFAFAFADIDVLHKSYAWLATPIQAIFYACFVISTIAALDRLEIGSGLMDGLKRGLSLQSGYCIYGPVGCMVFLSGIRAIAGLLSWPLLALSPNSNMLLMELRNPESIHENCEVP